MNGFGSSNESIRLYNSVGEKYFDSTEGERKRFIELAEEKALQLGSDAKNFAKLFYETHSKCPISNVYTYFLHAAHILWGMSFDLSVKARSAQATTVHVIHEGKPLTITIESV